MRMLSVGSSAGSSNRRRKRVRRLAALVLLSGACVAGKAGAQGCTTQAKMTPEQRAGAGAAAYKLASAVLSGNSGAVQAETIPPYSTNFEQTANLIHATSAKTTGDAVAVAQLYLLDATNRTASDSSEAEFSCPLSGTSAETDFAISGLPGGKYAFAMVEASGPNPWLLSFLLQAEGSGWKMAGFYPHRRDAAGHNGLWYWTVARADVKNGKPWLAWLFYGQADELLRPANFVSTTNLDRLRSETRTAAPPQLSGGLSEATPLALAGPNGADYRITGLNSQPSEDGRQLNLIVHLRGGGQLDSNAATARNLAAGIALLTTHPELRSGFDNLWVLAEAPNSNPFVTVRPMIESNVPK